jgi:hypothetical protein
MLGKDVGEHGVGYVVRNIVVNIIIQQRAKNFKRQKIIMENVVDMKLDLKRKTIALEVIILIVQKDGKSKAKNPFYTRWKRGKRHKRGNRHKKNNRHNKHNKHKIIVVLYALRYRVSMDHSQKP